MSSNLNEKTDNNILIFSNIETNKYLCEKIKQSKSNSGIFNSILPENSNSTFTKFSFMDVISDKKYNFLADLKQRKLFLVTKIKHFGSAFYGNINISSPTNIILSPIDPLMIFLNIVFYTTLQNHIEHYSNKDFSEEFLKEKFKNFSIADFKSFSLDDLFSDYFQKLLNNKTTKLDSDQLNENKFFIENFLIDYLKENEERLNLIAEKSYKLLDVLFFNQKTSENKFPNVKPEVDKMNNKSVNEEQKDKIEIIEKKNENQNNKFSDLMSVEKRKSEEIHEEKSVKKSEKSVPKSKTKPEIPKSQSNLHTYFSGKNK